MKVGLFTDSLGELEFPDALEWCAQRDIHHLELGTGGYSPAPHLDMPRLLESRAAREELWRQLSDAGAELAALNVSGNPLHPDRSLAQLHDQALRDALALAADLGVERVVAMSGCPGAPGPGTWPVFAGGAWLPDMEGLAEWQWAERILPYWQELSAWAARKAPDTLICLELHPGAAAYNAESYQRLRAATGENVCVNLDPSHFWWQGIDPVRTIAEIGDAVGFVHGKDTLIYPERVALHGVLDFRWPAGPEEMPWHFCVVGEGRPQEEWVALLTALRGAGYDGVISIEQEDPRYPEREGIDRSLRGLRQALTASAHPARAG